MTKKKQQNICTRCVLPTFGEKDSLNSTDSCGLCQNYQTSSQQQKYLATDLEKLLRQHGGKNKYDCMVMCSGGKDSTLALYYMVKKFKLRTLAFTFNNGFEDKEAIKNVENATNKLNVDWLYFKTNFMKDAFRTIIESKTKATICHICSLWYLKLSYDTAANYKIPIIVAGWRKEQSDLDDNKVDEYEYLSTDTKGFIKNYLHKIPKYKNFPLNSKGATKEALKKQKIISLSPHWFTDEKPEDCLSLLKKELGWKQLKKSYPLGSTNCRLSFPNAFLSMKNFGFSHYTIEMSKRIRNGEMSREEAEKKLKINFDKKFVNSILKEIDCHL